MKHLQDIRPIDVLEEYIEMYEDQERWKDQGLIKEWEKTFGMWMTTLMQNATHGHENKMKLSLNRTNWRGKKTRALLSVMGEKEPRTLKELKRKFIAHHSQYR